MRRYARIEKTFASVSRLAERDGQISEWRIFREWLCTTPGRCGWRVATLTVTCAGTADANRDGIGERGLTRATIGSRSVAVLQVLCRALGQ